MISGAWEERSDDPPQEKHPRAYRRNKTLQKIHHAIAIPGWGRKSPIFGGGLEC